MSLPLSQNKNGRNTAIHTKLEPLAFAERVTPDRVQKWQRQWRRIPMPNQGTCLIHFNIVVRYRIGKSPHQQSKWTRP